jgi:hypothetical protein
VRQDFENKMKLAQTILSKLRRSDLFVENRSAQDSKLRRSGIFLRRKDVAPTELNNFLIALATNMSRLRRCNTEIFLDALATKIPLLRSWEMALARG